MLLRPRDKGLLLWLLSFLPDFILDSLGTSGKGFFEPGSLDLPHVTYEEHSIGAAVRLFQIVRRVRKMIRDIKAPVLIIQDPEDYHVPPSVPPLIARSARSAAVLQVWVKDGHHVLTKGRKHKEIYARVAEHFKGASKNSPKPPKESSYLGLSQ